MTTLDSEVRSVVLAFVQSGELFTALDVSNKVKMVQPLARHSQVRDIVRELFTTDIEPANWARSPITVTLPDNTTATALLYHPLSDSWDLDNKYDLQKRAQGSVKVTAPTTTGVVVKAVVAGSVMPLPSPAPVAAPLPYKDQWSNLFNSKPSLFPLK